MCEWHPAPGTAPVKNASTLPAEVAPRTPEFTVSEPQRGDKGSRDRGQCLSRLRSCVLDRAIRDWDVDRRLHGELLARTFFQAVRVSDTKTILRYVSSSSLRNLGRAMSPATRLVPFPFDISVPESFFVRRSVVIRAIDQCICFSTGLQRSPSARIEPAFWSAALGLVTVWPWTVTIYCPRWAVYRSIAESMSTRGSYDFLPSQNGAA